MTDKLNMALDDIIKTEKHKGGTKNAAQRAAGRSLASGRRLASGTPRSSSSSSSSRPAAPRQLSAQTRRPTQLRSSSSPSRPARRPETRQTPPSHTRNAGPRTLSQRTGRVNKRQPPQQPRASAASMHRLPAGSSRFPPQNFEITIVNERAREASRSPLSRPAMHRREGYGEVSSMRPSLSRYRPPAAHASLFSSHGKSRSGPAPMMVDSTIRKP